MDRRFNAVTWRYGNSTFNSQRKSLTKVLFTKRASMAEELASSTRRIDVSVLCGTCLQFLVEELDSAEPKERADEAPEKTEFEKEDVEKPKVSGRKTSYFN